MVVEDKDVKEEAVMVDEADKVEPHLVNVVKRSIKEVHLRNKAIATEVKVVIKVAVMVVATAVIKTKDTISLKVSFLQQFTQPKLLFKLEDVDAAPVVAEVVDANSTMLNKRLQ